MRINVTITNQAIRSLVIDFVEGNLVNWHGNIDGYDGIAISNDGRINFTVVDEETGKRHRVTMAKLKRGLQALVKKAPICFGEILADKTDFDTADALMQCTLFGDIIYG